MTRSYRAGLMTGAALVLVAVLVAAWLPGATRQGAASIPGQLAAIDDTTMVRTLLAEARGTSLLLCEMASAQMRGNYWGRNREPVDDEVRDVLQRVQDDPTDPAVVELLGDALSDADPCVARTAARLLGRTDHQGAVDRLLSALTDSSAQVREMASLGLGVAEPAAALDPLIQVLRRDQEDRARIMAAWALGELENDEAVGPLSASLADGSPRLRAASAAALGEIESAEAVPALVRALEDDDPRVRLNSAWALGEIEDGAAVEALSRTLLADSEAQVRAAAARALGEIEH